ncbi:hypothetical protein MNBD_NITROSPIRAE01-679 [hydrothermal vent metagenome]|uniref:Uncharacterized protein n=1 Tax=hydrothermal vent metagenome TaxID=652676 RepID=A0A3B1CIU0_9ZZZZ
MITRLIGFSTAILLALSALDYYDIIQITATPLKQLVDAIIGLAETFKEKI